MASKAVAEQAPLKIYTLSYPPFMFEEKGQIKGLQVEIVQEAFKNLNVPIEMKLVHLLEGLKMVEKGEIDGFFSPFKTPEREKVMQFSQSPLYVEEIVLVGHKSQVHLFDGTIESLQKADIGMKRGYYMGLRMEEALKLRRFRRINVNDLESLVEMMLTGQLDYIAHEKFNLERALQLYDPKGNLKILTPAIESEPAFLVFRKDAALSPLIKAYDHEIKRLYQTGFVEKLERHYIGTGQ